jgi:hypothetical protein
MFTPEPNTPDDDLTTVRRTLPTKTPENQQSFDDERTQPERPAAKKKSKAAL